MKIISAIVVIYAVAVAADECGQDTYPHHQTKGTPVVLKPVQLPPPYKFWNITIPAFEACNFVTPTSVVVSACDHGRAPSVEVVNLQTAFVERFVFPVTTEATVFVTVFCDTFFKPAKGVVATPVQVPAAAPRRDFDSNFNKKRSVEIFDI